MQLAADRLGTGPSLVLVHGIAENRTAWGPVVPLLAEWFDVLNVDLRGHGASAHGDAYDPVSLAGDLVETWSAAGMEAPLLVGHSLGGVVVTAAAVVGSPRAVVNVDQPLRLADFKAALGQLESMLRGSAEEFSAAIDMIFDVMHGPLPADEVDRVRSLRRPEQDVVMAIWGTVFDSTPKELDATVGALAGAVTVPYLSLHGIDPGPEYPEWLCSLVPTAVVEEWPDHGHYPHLIDPERFVARIRAFDAGQ